MFGVLLTLAATEILLFVGDFSTSSSTVKIGGVLGILTAVVAWYTSATGLVNSV